MNEAILIYVYIRPLYWPLYWPSTCRSGHLAQQATLVAQYIIMCTQ